MGLGNQSLLPPGQLFQRNIFSPTALRLRSSFPEQLQRYFPLLFKLSVKCPHILVYFSFEKRSYFHERLFQSISTQVNVNFNYIKDHSICTFISQLWTLYQLPNYPFQHFRIQPIFSLQFKALPFFYGKNVLKK